MLTERPDDGAVFSTGHGVFSGAIGVRGCEDCFDGSQSGDSIVKPLSAKPTSQAVALGFLNTAPLERDVSLDGIRELHSDRLDM